MDLWIQSPDFSTREQSDVSLEQAERALAGEDWAGMLRKAAVEGSDECPPGLGLVAEDGSLLHICPDAPGTATVYYMYKEKKKVLGFLPCTAQREHCVESAAPVTVRDLMRAHFDGDRATILRS